MTTKRTDLDQLAVIINAVLNVPFEYRIQGAYGRVRLVRAQGSVEVSPSLTKPELELWMRAFIAGIHEGSRASV